MRRALMQQQHSWSILTDVTMTMSDLEESFISIVDLWAHKSYMPFIYLGHQ